MRSDEAAHFWDVKIANRPHLPVRNMAFFAPETKALGLECIPSEVVDPFQARRKVFVVHEGGQGIQRELTAADHREAIRAAVGVIGASALALARIGTGQVRDYFAAKLEASRFALWGGYAVAGAVGGLANYSLGLTFL